MKIAIIGGGVMGEIIARSLIRRRIVRPADVVVAEVVESRRALLAERHRVTVSGDAAGAVDGAELVLLCVKPQSARETLAGLRGHIRPEALVVSIMAGVSLASLQAGLGHRGVVRSMPNIPAGIGEGMTVWMADPAVPELQLLLAKMVFQAFGQETMVASDDQVDAATAVSGSGPAYIFYVAEKLIAAARGLGFEADEAAHMVRQTFRGAMDMWEQTGSHPEELRAMVTSKGGTTQAAVTRFEELKTGEVFGEAIGAAYRRARELGAAVSDPPPGSP